MVTTLHAQTAEEGIARRVRRRSIRRAVAHGALLLIPFTYALVTLLR